MKTEEEKQLAYTSAETPTVRHLNSHPELRLQTTEEDTLGGKALKLPRC